MCLFFFFSIVRSVDGDCFIYGTPAAAARRAVGVDGSLNKVGRVRVNVIASGRPIGWDQVTLPPRLFLVYFELIVAVSLRERIRVRAGPCLCSDFCGSPT